MKNKIIGFGILCIITSIAFTSCKSSNISVMKRHYNNGYYISHNSGKQATKVLTKEQKNKKRSKIEVQQVQQVIKKETTVTSEQKVVIENNILTASNEKKQYKTNAKKNVTQLKSVQTKIIEKRTSQIKNIVFETKKKHNNSTDEDDALSLFWIIILAILILWAIGALAGGFGLGGLIHLLLVIALVLFILWLLRII